MWHNSILETIGNTPLIKLNAIAEDVEATILAKVEYFNPGQSVKDRIAIKMLEDAEKEGKIKPGGTIIEGTSGNTGMGLALAAIVKGYKSIFTTTDKQSMEKVNLLRALGAEVRICPTNVEPDDPRSYYSVAKRLSEEIPNSFYPNQYDNPSNAQAHYESTGPELWEQTEGKITHFVGGMGTGGTVSGTARFLKEQNPKVKIVGVDSVGSVYKSYFETGEFDKSQIAPYLTEGIGEDIIPENMDFDLLDEVIQCPDREAFVTTRALARKEGLFIGGSCGAAVWGALEYAREANLTKDDIVVVLLPDSGTRYVSKVYNDEWMRQNGFLQGAADLRADEIVSNRTGSQGSKQTTGVKTDDTLEDAINVMNDHDISQLPVFDGQKQVGSLQETSILNQLIADPASKSKTVVEVMGDPFPEVDQTTELEELSALLTKQVAAVLVKNQSDGSFEIITKSDLINAIAAYKNS